MKRILKTLIVVVAAMASVFSYAQSLARVEPPSDGSISVHHEAKPVSALAADDYLIGADDVLAINVWKEPDLCRTVPVRPDGKITLPLIGDIAASGKTPRKLQQEIQEGLAAFVAVPEVTVIVQEVKSRKFNIVGEVTKPGSYPLTESTTVLDAIAQAGGLAEFAKSNNIYVLRIRPDGSSSRLPFQYKHVLKGSKLAQNIQLQSHDTVVVP